MRLFLLASLALMLSVHPACKSGQKQAEPADRVYNDSSLIGDPVFQAEQAEGPALGSFIFGSFCGMCQKNCAPMFRLEPGETGMSMDWDQSDSYRTYPRKLVFETKVEDPARKAQAAQLMKALPTALLEASESEKTYGCPDCADGCGVYLEFQMKGEEGVKKYWIDPWDRGSVPKEIVAYARTVMEVVGKLSKSDE